MCERIQWVPRVCLGACTAFSTQMPLHFPIVKTQCKENTILLKLKQIVEIVNGTKISLCVCCYCHLLKELREKKRHAHTHARSYVWYTFIHTTRRIHIDGMLQNEKRNTTTTQVGAYMYVVCVYDSQFIVISIRLFNDFRFSCYLCIDSVFGAMMVCLSVYSTEYNYIEMKVFVCLYVSL